MVRVGWRIKTMKRRNVFYTLFALLASFTNLFSKSKTTPNPSVVTEADWEYTRYMEMKMRRIHGVGNIEPRHYFDALMERCRSCGLRDEESTSIIETALQSEVDKRLRKAG